MAIELSSLTFTEQDDVVPPSGVEEIVNSGIANTLAGDDIIKGTDSYYGNIGLQNYSGINTGDGDDTLIGDSYWNNGIVNNGTINTGVGKDNITAYGGIYNFNAIETGADDDEITASSSGPGIGNEGIIDTGDGHDIITGTAWAELDPRFPFLSNGGISNRRSDSIIDTGNDNDTITGTGDLSIDNSGSINTGNGEDSIISEGVFINRGSINTDNGEDSILSEGGFINSGSINTGNSEDFILSEEEPFINYGGVFLGEGDDSISSYSSYSAYFDPLLQNFNFIGTGDGNDTIASGGIYNQGVIETGNGNDSIIIYGSLYGSDGTLYSIDNNGGAINMGDGNDSIITLAGFTSAPNSSGSVFLGEGDDYIRGSGSGDFYGGNGNDTLELTPGTYTVGIWDTSATFTNGNQLMITSEFEKLKVGSTIYDFSSLTAGQIIVVA